MADIYFPKPAPLSPNTRARYNSDNESWYIKQKGRERLVKGVPTADSLYYWWLQYLKRSEFYKAACGLSVNFSENRKIEYEAWYSEYGERLLSDFGNIFKSSDTQDELTDFWRWWNEDTNTNWKRGIHLFGINPVQQMSDFLSFDDVCEIETQIHKGDYKVIAIPTNLTKNSIRHKVAKLLKQLEVTPSDEIKALYHPASLKVDCVSLGNCLAAYDARESGKSNLQIGAEFAFGKTTVKELKRDARKNGKSYAAEAIQRIVEAKNIPVEEYDVSVERGDYGYLDEGKERTAKKNYLNVKASRMIKKAKANIHAVEKGIFPLGH